jgi:signal transduction histidine kinase
LQLQLLDRAPDAGARGEAQRELGAAVDRAVHLVEQLLTLARNEPRAAGEDLRPVPLQPIVAEGIAETHALAVSRGIELSLDAEPGVIVPANAAALRVLVRNLVDNAVRYTPLGGRVQVRLSQRPAEIRLEIIDSGPGIPAVDRERAFDRFYRRSNAPEGGSGLGLAIVRAIAERHGARVALEDAAGGGLQVVVSFPRRP